MSGADPLAGSAWEVVALAGAPVPQDAPRPWLAFGPIGRMAGHAGVNRVAGPYTASDGVLHVEPLVATRMAGPRPRMEMEARLMEVLAGPAPFELRGDELRLTGPAGPVTLRRRAEGPPAPSA